MKKIGNRINNLSEKTCTIFTYIAFFMIFFHPFNISFKDLIFPNQESILLFYLIPLVLLVITNYNNIKKFVKIYKKTIIITAIIVFFLVIFRNGDIINKHFGMPFFTVFLFLLLLILSPSKKWRNIALNVIMVYILEHTIASWICYFFRGFYFENILPLFPDFQKELIWEFEHNQIAGITQHYSTNASYLLIGVIVEIFGFRFWNKDRRIFSFINILIFILTFGALLITGKRAQILFGLIAIVFVLIIKYRTDFKKIKFKHIVITSCLILVSFSLISVLIPSILNPVTRVIEGIQKRDLMTTREPLYNLAIQAFNESKIVGHGWGSYKYLYHDLLLDRERDYMDTHNIYLQMLSEIGIIGLLVFISMTGYVLNISIKRFWKEKSNKYIAIFLAYQIYILLEGTVGNAFFDVQVLVPYSVFLAFLTCEMNLLNNGKYEKKKIDKEKNMREKILSISVAAYNIEKLISQNLESWLDKDILNKIEVLITDDGSKDNTANIVEKYEKEYPETIKLIKQENMGPGSTVNSGLKHAKGKYFRMVDGDDWVIKENLKQYISKLESTNADMILTNYEVYNDSTKKIIDVVKADIEPEKIYDFDDVSKFIKPQMHNVTYKTSILKENSIVLDNGFYTDVEYLLLPLKYIETVVYYDIDIYVYRVGQLNQSVSIPSMQKNINMHTIVLDRMIAYFEDNKSELSSEKRRYLEKQIATVADAHLGTLLTFEMNDKIKKEIKDFNEELKQKSKLVYNVYKKSKKARIVIWSNYALCNLLSKMYVKKLSN